jgi:hypothetical protein
MEGLLQEILKHTNKISRIITKVSQQEPQLSAQLDLALYSSLKIEKMVRKHSDLLSPGPPEGNPGKVSYSDPIFDAAMRNIEGFKQVTSKLESKINVLVNESEQRQRPWRNRGGEEGREDFMNLKSRSRGKNEMRGDEYELPKESEDRSLSKIDQSILKITNKIIT